MGHALRDRGKRGERARENERERRERDREMRWMSVGYLGVRVVHRPLAVKPKDGKKQKQ